MKEKVVIGWPDGGNVYGGFTKSLLSLLHFELNNPNDRYEVLEPIRSTGLYITENRNELIRQAKEYKADWLLQIDGDETFNPSLLKTLLRTADKETRPVVVGIYANIGYVENGGFNLIDCVYAEGPDGRYRNMAPPKNLVPFIVDAAGTGVFLTHTSIYDKILPPWFWLEQLQLPDGKIQFMNEDIAFCRILRENGYKIWCDPLAEATHWKMLPLNASPTGQFIRKIGKDKQEHNINIGAEIVGV
jgi:GT2 family glycosyltransferase